MSSPAIDYDALAAQHGGTAAVDYDALAAQHGGSVASTGPAAPTDDRNFIQKGYDRLVNVTPEDQQGHGAIYNQAQKFGAGVIQGLGAPIAHPLDTLEGIGHAVAHPVDTATALVKSAVQNPAQAAGNVVGGALLGEAGAGAAGAVNKVASPVVSRALLLGKTPAEAYESALKPSTTLSQAQRADIVKTGLEQGIPVSKAGLEKIADRIDTLNSKIMEEIQQDPSRPINPSAVAARTNSTLNRFQNQVTAQPDLNAIKATRDQFLAERGARPGVPAQSPQPTGLVDAQGNPIMTQGVPAQPPRPAPPMAAEQAQRMKTGTYTILRGKYGEQGSAVVEAQKDLARGLKEEIAAQFPEIDNLNAAESRLLNLQPVLERAVNRISNHQLIGIGTPVAGAAAKAVTGSGGVGAVAMTLKAVLDNPVVKSRLAISLSKGAKIPYSQALARVGAYSSALQSTASAPQASSLDGTPSQ